MAPTQFILLIRLSRQVEFVGRKEVKSRVYLLLHMELLLIVQECRRFDSGQQGHAPSMGIMGSSDIDLLYVCIHVFIKHQPI